MLTETTHCSACNAQCDEYHESERILCRSCWESEDRPLDTFTHQYAETALWSSCDIDEGGNLDDSYDVEDINTDTLWTMVQDCRNFRDEEAVAAILESDECGADDSQAGHDFWLTRNRHGAGFWDRGSLYGSEDAGRILTDAAHVYGSIDLMPDGTGSVTA